MELSCGALEMFWKASYVTFTFICMTLDHKHFFPRYKPRGANHQHGECIFKWSLFYTRHCFHSPNQRTITCFSLSLSVPSYSMVNLNLIITRVLFISGNQPIHLGNVECNSFRDKSIPNHIFHVEFFLQLNIKKIIIWFWNKLNRIKGAWHSSLKLPIQKGRIQHALWCTHIAWFYWVKIGILNGI